jgi:hypothetical protein
MRPLAARVAALAAALGEPVLGVVELGIELERALEERARLFAIAGRERELAELERHRGVVGASRAAVSKLGARRRCAEPRERAAEVAAAPGNARRRRARAAAPPRRARRVDVEVDEPERCAAAVGRRGGRAAR